MLTDDEALVEQAAQFVLDNSRRGNASLNSEQFDADTTALMSAYRDIITKALPIIRTTDAARIAALEEALRNVESAISEYYRYWTGGETRGSYDGKPERAQLWAAGQAARATLRSNTNDR